MTRIKNVLKDNQAVIETAIALIGIWFIVVQTRLLNRQTVANENQLELARRPKISAEMLPSSSDSATRTGPWRIRNRGESAVQNLQVSVVYFTQFKGRGWYSMMPSGGPKRPLLEAEDGWDVALPWIPAMTDFRISGLTPDHRLDTLIALLYFERIIDGQAYVYIQPLQMENGKPYTIENIQSTGPFDLSMSGALAKHCDYGTELAIEYLSRRPLNTPYEIYNRGYFVGANRQKCLGPITWIK